MNFFNKFFKKPSSKEASKNPESKFLPKKKAVIEERFILKFIENGGKFLYCEDLDEVQENFDLILKENEWVNYLKKIQINSPTSMYVKKIGYVSSETLKIKIQDKKICNIRLEELTEKFNNSISAHF